MTEFQDIVRGLAAARSRGEAVVLATVVRVEGSAYRHPGARLLLGPEGARIGCVSGGCLEGDVQARAAEVLQAGVPRLVRYDLRTDLDLVWGTGSGCEGVADLLLEPILPGPPAGWLEAVENAFRARRPLRLATLLAVEDNSGHRVGEHLVLAEGASLPVGCTGLVEELVPPVALWILGAGEDARPLAALARTLGWRVGIADHRPALAQAARFPEADEILLGRPEQVIGRMHLDERSAVVLLSHLWERDLEALRLLLPSPAGYLGLLGHRTRGAKLLAALAEQGFVPAADQLARLYAPVGLDLGGREPAEIALAVVAEIEAVLCGRRGGHLRDRLAPIHG